MKDQNSTYEDWKKRFPLCFERKGGWMAFSLEYNAGWNGIVEELLGKIEGHLAEKQALGLLDPDCGFQINQIKEKFGTMRFYVSGADDTIFGFIDEAERKTANTCEMCGNSGALYTKRGKFWLRTFCAVHAEEYDYEPYNSEAANEDTND